jgi:predicted kinase
MFLCTLCHSSSYTPSSGSLKSLPVPFGYQYCRFHVHALFARLERLTCNNENRILARWNDERLERQSEATIDPVQVVVVDMYDDFQQWHLVDRQGALCGPSTASTECKTLTRTAYTHNVIEQQSWENPIDISDPKQRGYSTSREGSGLHRDADGKKDLDRGVGRDWFCGRRILNERAVSFINRPSPSKPSFDRRYPVFSSEVNDRSDVFNRPSYAKPMIGAGLHSNHSRNDHHRGGQGNQLSSNGNSSGDNKRRQKPTSRTLPNDDSHRERGPNRRERRNAEFNREENGPPHPSSSVVPQAAANLNSQQFMLILTGIPGSGKSTFAEALVRGKPDVYVRVNQDALGSRPLCEELTKRVLQHGMCPIIDRCNFDRSQRAKFLNIAKTFNIPADCVVFQIPMELCIRRCCERRRHETVNAENAAQIVRTMARQFSPPLSNRNNLETFRTIKVFDSTSAFHDLVEDYLNVFP